MLSDPEMAESAAEDRVDTRDAAREAGLAYVSDEEPGLRRKRNGRGFAYVDANGAKVRDERTLARVKALAIPPAYTDVWICRHANGHIQATGRDARGRKQYRYHPEFRQARESTKFAHMMSFAEVLPGLRATVQEHMARRGLPREKVLATVVHLLETTLIRVGNDDYAKQNKSYGLTTLRDPHVRIEGRELRFRFKGKSNKVWELAVHDRRVAKIVKACQDLPGQELFQYLDEDGVQRDVTSADVNAYLREITGRDITAKDFRTWSGTVLAAMALREFASFDTQAVAKRNVREAIERVAERLGNTPTICRKCYVHPEILGCYLEGELLLQVKDEVEAALREDIARLRPEETAVLALLQGRLARIEAKGKGRATRAEAASAKTGPAKDKTSPAKKRPSPAEKGPATGRSVKGGTRAGRTAARKAA
ncbi:DNA topoisomerase IB [Methylobacterium platani]|uniref:DNA topoisomerase n=2 Tax=Methylobacterium platani TaxID=427683 RepID=A0A179SIM1_9HYPH|nr:DNA topoisomerase IB [Methylobacterium platani]KMO19198.1 DNA topoisomerase I [Methylobacterium platani JCM 14648]OAS27656.1 DNA topoisomerase I [Methylobacterium platani]